MFLNRCIYALSGAISIKTLFEKAIFKFVFTFLVLAVLIQVEGSGKNILLLTSNKETYYPIREIEYLWDEEKQFNIETITRPEIQNKFQSFGDQVVSFGVLNKDIWLKVKIKNTIPHLGKNWILELAYPHYDSLEFYFQDDKKIWKHYLTGDLTSFNTREVFDKNFAFYIALQDTSLRTFYFHISGEGSRQFPMIVHSASNYDIAQKKITLVYGGVFFGIIIIMLLYNLFIFFSLRDKIYLYYVIANSLTMFFYLTYSGYGFQYLWPNYPEFNLIANQYSSVLAGVSGILFSRTFLESKIFAPLIDKILKLMVGIYSLFLILIPFLDFGISLIMVSNVSMISILLILYCSYRTWYKGNSYARFMALAFSLYLLGAILLTLNIRGFVDRGFWVAHSMEIGTVVEITLLSFALSDKYRRLKEDNEKAQNELLDMQKKINEELEHKVKLRTRELEELNLVNHKMISIISHDIKGPLNTFQSLLSMMLEDEITKDKISMYTMHLNNKLSTMVVMVDNILHWVRTQMKGMKFDIQTVRLKELIVETVNFYSSQADLKNIEIEVQVEADILLQADKNVIRLIVRNLLNNALKFTNNNGKVIISATCEDDKIIVAVRDTGVGMDADKLKRLFTNAHFTTPDTGNNSGTGLGLLLCQEFLHQIGGEIWAESEPGKGSTFKFRLPAAKNNS